MQDGGLVANNPTALAINQAKLLFPNKDIDIVLSVGTGKVIHTSPRKYNLNNLLEHIVLAGSGYRNHSQDVENDS